MILPPITKEQKITLLITAFFLLTLCVFFFWKPSKEHIEYQPPLLNNARIDTLESKLRQQKILSESYIARINELEKFRDSVMNKMKNNNTKLTTIQKRRTDEKKVNYDAWTDNEFTRFFANRYQQH